MLTWDETKEAVLKAQTTQPPEFERHLANYVVQGVIQKLQDDYVSITMHRMDDAGMDVTDPNTIEIVAHECAIFMTGVQVGWNLAEAAFRHE
jgi:hypothetical protein